MATATWSLASLDILAVAPIVAQTWVRSRCTAVQRSACHPPRLALRERDLIDTQLGQAVAMAGDVNGDGYDDLVAGAPSGIVELPYRPGAGLLRLAARPGAGPTLDRPARRGRRRLRRPACAGRRRQRRRLRRPAGRSLHLLRQLHQLRPDPRLLRIGGRAARQPHPRPTGRPATHHRRRPRRLDAADRLHPRPQFGRHASRPAGSTRRRSRHAASRLDRQRPLPRLPRYPTTRWSTTAPRSGTTTRSSWASTQSGTATRPAAIPTSTRSTPMAASATSATRPCLSPSRRQQWPRPAAGTSKCASRPPPVRLLQHPRARHGLDLQPRPARRRRWRPVGQLPGLARRQHRGRRGLRRDGDGRHPRTDGGTCRSSSRGSCRSAAGITQSPAELSPETVASTVVIQVPEQNPMPDWVGSGSGSLAGDVNGDGFDDVLMYRRMGGDSWVELFLGSSAGISTERNWWRGKPGSRLLAISTATASTT